MKTSEELKTLVKEKYTEIAGQSLEQNKTSCCGSGCCTVDHAVFAEDYEKLKGYMPEADLGLGCGLPTEFAQIRPGDTVVDLGSGAGNDCFVARVITGETGKVIGVDMTEVMVEKARDNAEKMGYNNVEFRLGDIEKLPIGGNRADVVVSNCVLNLVPDKHKAFAEMYRILKPGGHFSISDVVLIGDLPPQMVQAGEMYAGCVSGAIQKSAYLDIISEAGFRDVTLQKEKAIFLPDEILKDYMSPAEIATFRDSGTGIFSITVFGRKPEDKACCDPGCC